MSVPHSFEAINANQRHVLDVRASEPAGGWGLDGSDVDAVILHTGNELQATTIRRAARGQTGTTATLQIPAPVSQTATTAVPPDQADGALCAAK